MGEVEFEEDDEHAYAEFRGDIVANSNSTINNNYMSSNNNYNNINNSNSHNNLNMNYNSMNGNNSNSNMMSNMNANNSMSSGGPTIIVTEHPPAQPVHLPFESYFSQANANANVNGSHGRLNTAQLFDEIFSKELDADHEDSLLHDPEMQRKLGLIGGWFQTCVYGCMRICLVIF